MNPFNIAVLRVQFFKIHTVRDWVFPISFVLLAVFFSLAIQRYFQNTPAQSDGGAFAAIALGMEHGKVLYKTVWDNKAPGVFFLNRWALALVSSPEQATNVLRFAFIFLLNLAFFLFAGKSVWRLVIACILLPFIWQQIIDWKFFESGHYTEFYGIVLIMFSAALMRWNVSKIGLLRYFIMGVFMAYSVLIKEPFVFIFIAVSIYFSITHFRNKPILNAYWAGVAMPIVLFIAYLSLHSIWSEYFSYLNFAMHYSAENKNHTAWQNFLDWRQYWLLAFPLITVVFLPFFLSFLDLSFQRKNQFFAFLLVAIFLASWVFPTLGGQLYMHYFLPSHIVLAVMLLQSIYWFLEILPQRLPIKNWEIGTRILLALWMLWMLKPYVLQGMVFFYTQTYKLHQTMQKEKTAVQQLIPAEESVFVEHEGMGRFYLYHPKTFPNHPFPCPYIAYFGTETPNEAQMGNRQMLKAAFDKNPPQWIIGRKTPGTSMVYAGLVETIENTYRLTDSLMSTEGEMLYIRRRKD